MRTSIAILLIMENYLLVDDTTKIYDVFKIVGNKITDENLLVKKIMQVKYPIEISEELYKLNYDSWN